nr:hypothetical protein [Oscillospiraceae bacterium]
MKNLLLKRGLALFLALIMCTGMLPISALAEDAAVEEQTPPPHEHSWSGWTVVTPATCSSAGTQQRVCDGCGEIQTSSVDALPHSFGDWTVVTPATCSEAGVQ